MIEKATTTKKKLIQRQFTGVVKSMGQKTIQVLVNRQKMDAKYHKQYFESKKYAVHDENSLAKVGDKVLFVECRPISRMKKWRLIKIV